MLPELPPEYPLKKKGITGKRKLQVNVKRKGPAVLPFKRFKDDSVGDTASRKLSVGVEKVKKLR